MSNKAKNVHFEALEDYSDEELGLPQDPLTLETTIRRRDRVKKDRDRERYLRKQTLNQDAATFHRGVADALPAGEIRELVEKKARSLEEKTKGRSYSPGALSSADSHHSRSKRDHSKEKFKGKVRRHRTYVERDLGEWFDTIQ